MSRIRAVTYRCTGVVSIGACESEEGLFRHAFRRGAPTLRGDDVDGCVNVTSRGIEDGGESCGSGHGGPARRLGALVSFETDEGVRRYDGVSLWTDASRHRLMLVRDNGGPRNGGVSVSDGLVYAYRPTCEECQAMKPHVAEIARYVRVVSFDVDRNPALARRFGIKGVPTLLVVKGGWRVREVKSIPHFAAALRRNAKRTNPERSSTVRQRVAAYLGRVADYGVEVQDESSLLDEVDETLSSDENIRIIAKRFGFPTPAEMGRGVTGVVMGQESRALMKELERCQARETTPLAPDPATGGESCKTVDGMRGCVVEGRRAWRWTGVSRA